MRVLITGGYGFAGCHLADHMVQCGDDVAVSYLPNSDENVSPAWRLPKRLQTVALDITKREQVYELISVLKPDTICHLAASTFVPAGDTDSVRMFQVNTYGTLNVLDAVAEKSPTTRVLFVSSSEVYGDPRPGTLPLNESAELRPQSNYGLSKAWADLAAFNYSIRRDLNIVRVRPFPHIGPGQRDCFALASFTKQIAEIKLGKKTPVIQVGNLEARRDYSDVSDIVRGYREVLLNGKRGGVYNLASGQSHEIGALLRKLLEIAEVDAEIQVDESRIRTTDIACIEGSYEKAQKEFGWKPRVDIEAALHGLYAYWAEKLL